MAAGDLIGEPRWLGRIIRSTGPAIGTDDPMVAASLFVQGYAYRVLTVTMACLTSSGVVPDASATGMAVGLARGWPSLVAFTGPRVLLLDRTDDMAVLRTDPETTDAALRFVLDRAVAGHLRLLVESVRAGMDVALGERLLWGNIAASAATAFRTMAGCLGPWVEALGERFFSLAPGELHGLGSFSVVEEGGRRGWFWERTNCCLFDRLPGGVRCADCSRTPESERHRAYRASLQTS